MAAVESILDRIAAATSVIRTRTEHADRVARHGVSEDVLKDRTRKAADALRDVADALEEAVEEV